MFLEVTCHSRRSSKKGYACDTYVYLPYTWWDLPDILFLNVLLLRGPKNHSQKGAYDTPLVAPVTRTQNGRRIDWLFQGCKVLPGT